ncbi:MAG TPA: hypothetical protein VFH51_11145, partial [Myxococcota bacterium]|nr:hypothetical protein [Myxococcota bacterium]
MLDSIRRLQAQVAARFAARRHGAPGPTELPADRVETPRPDAPGVPAVKSRLEALAHPVARLQKKSAQLALRKQMQPLLEIAAEHQRLAAEELRLATPERRPAAQALSKERYAVAYRFHHGIVAAAERHGVDPAWLLQRTGAGRTTSPLHQAISTGDVQSALLFLDHGVRATPLLTQGSLTQSEPPTILMAASLGQAEVVRRLAEPTRRALAAAKQEAER